VTITEPRLEHLMAAPMPGLLSLLDRIERSRPAFHADAACREHPEVTWFPEVGEPTAPAKAICASCLVRDDCRSWALDQGPALQGVWGGTTPSSRAHLRLDRTQACAG
jgi:WhiB family redox-sensing transcriptional regulator